MIFTILLIVLVPANVFAEDSDYNHQHACSNSGTCNHIHTNKAISIDDFKKIVDDQFEPMSQSCCQGYPDLVWVHNYTWHLYDTYSGICLSLAYFGDQVCRKCGSIWVYNTCYYQTSSGCGQIHGVI